MRSRASSPWTAFLPVLLAQAVVHAADAPGVADQHAHEVTGGKEEVHVFRTSRTQRVRGSTELCRAAPFESVAEDHYALASFTTDSATSRIDDSHVLPVGEFRACFGAAVTGQPIAMYARGRVGALEWSGRGECSGMPSQPPDRRVVAFNCNLTLDGLPPEYVGGWATSSTLQPVLGADAAADAKVEGYLSTSVVVMRVWRRVEPGRPD